MKEKGAEDLYNQKAFGFYAIKLMVNHWRFKWKLWHDQINVLGIKWWMIFGKCTGEEVMVPSGIKVKKTCNIRDDDVLDSNWVNGIFCLFVLVTLF